jgi:GYF domain 2
MGIRFHCGACHDRLHVKDFLAGKRGRCPKCDAQIEIPSSSTIDETGAPIFSLPADSVAVGTAQGSVAHSRGMTDERKAKPHSERNQRVKAKGISQEVPRAERETAVARERGDIRTGANEIVFVEIDQRDANKRSTSTNVRSNDPDIEFLRHKSDQEKTKESEPAVQGSASLSASSEVRSASKTASSRPTVESSEPATKAVESESRKDTPRVGSTGAASTETVVVDSRKSATEIDPFIALRQAPFAAWFVAPSSGGRYGPANSETMQQWLQDGRVSRDSLVWREGWADWLPAHTVFPIYGGPPQVMPPILESTVQPSVTAYAGESSGTETAIAGSASTATRGGRTSAGSATQVESGSAIQSASPMSPTAGEQSGESAANVSLGSNASQSRSNATIIRYHQARMRARTFGVLLVLGLFAISAILVGLLVFVLTRG